MQTRHIHSFTWITYYGFFSRITPHFAIGSRLLCSLFPFVLRKKYPPLLYVHFSLCTTPCGFILVSGSLEIRLLDLVNVSGNENQSSSSLRKVIPEPFFLTFYVTLMGKTSLELLVLANLHISPSWEFLPVFSLAQNFNVPFSITCLTVGHFYQLHSCM
jgi:hypothetical protein